MEVSTLRAVIKRGITRPVCLDQSAESMREDFQRHPITETTTAASSRPERTCPGDRARRSTSSKTVPRGRPRGVNKSAGARVGAGEHRMRVHDARKKGSP